MKRSIALLAVLLCVTAAAQADVITAVYEEITTPTPTTWRLWLTETTNWDGNPADMTPSGFGIGGFNIDLTGVVTASKAGTVALGAVIKDITGDSPVTLGTVGFPNGGGSASVDAGGNASAFAGQDTTFAMGIFYGFGVSAGSFPAPDPNSYSISGDTISWLAPGAPGSTTPGVLVFSGKRVAGTVPSVVWSDRDQANVFNAGTGADSTTVPVVGAVPEPATMALLVLGGLAALRRRR